MQVLTLILAILFAGPPTLALVNDWDVPCHQGQCSWDLPSDASSSGSLQIRGSSQSISDITTASGWTILDCDANKTTQDIRLVCTSNSTTEAGCDHLLDSGVEGKIVRLPEDCGSMPFARVAKAWISEDQAIPASANLSGSSLFQVRALSLDTDFGALDSAKYVIVSFSVQTSSLPGRSNTIDLITPAQRRRYHPRSFVSPTETQHRRLLARDDANGTATNETQSKTFPPIDVNKNFNLFNASVDCSAGNLSPVPFKASVKVDVDARAHAEISIGVSVMGTLVPPSLGQAMITAGFTGNINSTLNLQANAGGSFSSPSLTLLQIPLAGIVIPGILTLGPEFKVTAQITADLEVGIDTQVGLAYAVDNATLVFPPSEGRSSGSFKQVESPLRVNTNTSVTGDATISAHLTPTLDIGLDAFSGIASATLSLTLDATATLEVNGTATAITAKGQPADVSAKGCVDVRSGLDVSAGANAGLFGLFDESTSVTLFSKTFDLFNTCADTGNDVGTNSTSTSHAMEYTSTSTKDHSTTSTAMAHATTYTYMATYSPSVMDCISKCSSSYMPLYSSPTSATIASASASVSPSPSPYMVSSPIGYAMAPSYGRRRVVELVKRVDLTCPSFLR
ncbi:hypothetical protein OF83DRAFT_1169791 [Amylostereum chailletii]|nr:hypothetical protein OF83DRAFT_1169791 [Amylostereum chailletii]